MIVYSLVRGKFGCVQADASSEQNRNLWYILGPTVSKSKRESISDLLIVNFPQGAGGVVAGVGGDVRIAATAAI